MQIKDILNLAKTVLFLPKTVSTLPRHIQIDVTTRCNLNCMMCASDEIISENDRNKDMSFEEFCKIIDSIKPFSVNLAANGEPFLNQDLFKMINYARSKGIKTVISSNFITSRALIDKIIESRLDILKISIDGAKKETYEKIRGNNYEKLIDNLKYLAEKKKENNTQIPEVRFDFVIMKDNYAEILDYAGFASKYNVKHIYFHPIDIKEYTKDAMSNMVYGVDLKALKRSLFSVNSLAKKQRIKTNVPALLKNFKMIETLYSDPSKSIEKRSLCLFPWLGAFITVKGNVSPCCAIYPKSGGLCGNVYEDPDFANLWNSSTMKKMREIFRERKNYSVYEGCKTCYLPMDMYTLIDSAKTFPGYLKKILKTGSKES